MPKPYGEVRRRRSRKTPSPSRPAPSCVRVSSTATRCRTTPSSTRSWPGTSTLTSAVRNCWPPGPTQPWSTAWSEWSTRPSTSVGSPRRDPRSRSRRLAAIAGYPSPTASKAESPRTPDVTSCTGRCPAAAAGGTIPMSPGTASGGLEEHEETTMSHAHEPEVATRYGGVTNRRVRTRDLLAAKERGEKWAMLTSYDQYTAAIFDRVGIPVLLVGDSAANNVYGYETTLPVKLDELVPLVRAVVRATNRTLVVADMPFGSYEEGPTQALRTAVRFMKETGAHAVKLEGGRICAPQIAALTAAGIPVMAHVGFTPQREHTLGGYRVQGRGDAADEVLADARAVTDAGAFAVVLEMVPGVVAKRVTHEVAIPTIGIGAGPDTDAQVLVWQDMAGLRTGKMPRFVKRYADMAGVLAQAAGAYAADVRSGEFPAPEHTF